MSTYKMLTYNYKRMFHPRLGRFVYKHKGSGLIVDNIFNPMKRIMKKAMSVAIKPILKPITKKAIESVGNKLGNKLGKKAAEKSGHLFMKDLQKVVAKPTQKVVAKPTQKVVEDYNIILNRLISGSGKRRK